MVKTAKSLLAAMLVVCAMALAPGIALAGGGTDFNSATELAVGERQSCTSSADAVDVYFTYTIAQAGEYTISIEGRSPELSLYDSSQSDLGASCEDNHTEFYAEPGTYYLRLNDYYVRATGGGSQDFTVLLSAEGGEGQGIALGAPDLSEGNLLWLGSYNNVPTAWVVDGDGVHARHVLWDGEYHNSTAQSSCTGYADTDLYKSTLPSFKANSFSELEAKAVENMKLPGNVGIGYSRNGEAKNYWIEKEFGTWEDSWTGWYVIARGFEKDDNLDCYLGVRPAFSPNLTSVIFSSAAVGGKTSGAVGASCLAEVSAGSGGTKLTLHDEGRDGFALDAPAADRLTAAVGYSSWTIPIAYSGAATGGDEYVSAILCNGGGQPLYYGHLANNSQEGTVDLAIPAGLGKGSYTLHVFSEQCNGDLRTDYASALVDIALTVGDPEPPAPAKESIKDAKVVLSKASFTYNGKVQKPAIKTIGGKSLKEGTDYTAKWSNASSKNAGTYTITISGKGSYEGTTKATYKIAKAPNTLVVKAKKVKLSAKKLKKKAQAIKRTAALTVSNARGTVTYAKAGVNKSAKKFSINATNGKITVKKGVKKGTYKMKVKVKAAETDNYKPKTQTVTVKIVVG